MSQEVISFREYTLDRIRSTMRDRAPGRAPGPYGSPAGQYPPGRSPVALMISRCGFEKEIAVPSPPKSRIQTAAFSMIEPSGHSSDQGIAPTEIITFELNHYVYRERYCGVYVEKDEITPLRAEILRLRQTVGDRDADIAILKSNVESKVREVDYLNRLKDIYRWRIVRMRREHPFRTFRYANSIIRRAWRNRWIAKMI